MKILSLRQTYFLGLLWVIGLLLISYYLQTHDGMIPCPLCILQRIAMCLLGFCFLIGTLMTTTRLKSILVGCVSCFISILGIVLSGRQVWLQQLPPNLTADCGASLDYLLHVLPLDQVVQKIFQGTAECSEINWQFLHLSLAEWSLFTFFYLLVFSLFQLKRGFRYPSSSDI